MAGLPLIVFDVNETLLDLGTMEPTFERIFGEKSAMRLWFANFIMYSAALTVAGCSKRNGGLRLVCGTFMNRLLSHSVGERNNIGGDPVAFGRPGF